LQRSSPKGLYCQTTRNSEEPGKYLDDDFSKEKTIHAEAISNYRREPSIFANLRGISRLCGRFLKDKQSLLEGAELDDFDLRCKNRMFDFKSH